MRISSLFHLLLIVIHIRFNESFRDKSCKSMIDLPNPLSEGVMFDYAITGDVSYIDVKGVERQQVWIRNSNANRNIVSVFYDHIPMDVRICSKDNPNVMLERVDKYSLDENFLIYKEKNISRSKDIIKRNGEIKISDSQILSEYL